MRHQVRLLPDGFDCVCGFKARFRRVDATRENINAAIDEHIHEEERAEAARPEKGDVERLLDEFKAFQENYDRKTFAPTTDSDRFMELPDIPAPFIQAFERIVTAFPRGTFRTLEAAIADPGDPLLRDVLNDLYRAKNMSR